MEAGLETLVRRQLTIFFDSDSDEATVNIISDMLGDVWDDIAVLMEALGTAVDAARNSNYTEHEGKSIEQYLHEYLDKVLNDRRKIVTNIVLDS